MSKKPSIRLAILSSLLVCTALAAAEDNPGQKLNQEFQSAVAQYDAGRFHEAAAQLEDLLPRAPNSFEVHELLGQAYASLSQDAKAIEHLEAAVRLNPASAPARENLAASLWRSGKTQLAEVQFRKALALEPGAFDANHNLGEFYARSGRLTDAIPLLEKAQQINPSSYENGYDLALAEFMVGQLQKATQLVEDLIKVKNTGELHDLLGQIEEKSGNSLAAVKEFEIAARLDPSEENLFDWGGELLLHRTYEPATEVFREAARRYPNSSRLMIGLGLALDWRGKYDDAVKALLTAADLAPSDPRCYLYLSKAYDSSPNQAQEVIQRFRRYAELEPTNALAQYYYALSLWKGKRVGDPSLDLQTVEALLERSIALDDSLPEAHVQLGNLYADQHQYEKSIPQYVRALKLNPNLPDAHYRLGTDYVRIGQKDQAQKEFDVYQKLRAQHLAAVDKEKAEVQQFVYSSQGGSSATH